MVRKLVLGCILSVPFLLAQIELNFAAPGDDQIMESLNWRDVKAALLKLVGPDQAPLVDELIFQVRDARQVKASRDLLKRLNLSFDDEFRGRFWRNHNSIPADRNDWTKAQRDALFAFAELSLVKASPYEHEVASSSTSPAVVGTRVGVAAGIEPREPRAPVSATPAPEMEEPIAGSPALTPAIPDQMAQYRDFDAWKRRWMAFTHKQSNVETLFRVMRLNLHGYRANNSDWGKYGAAPVPGAFFGSDVEIGGIDGYLFESFIRDNLDETGVPYLDRFFAEATKSQEKRGVREMTSAEVAVVETFYTLIGQYRFMRSASKREAKLGARNKELPGIRTGYFKSPKVVGKLASLNGDAARIEAAQSKDTRLADALQPLMGPEQFRVFFENWEISQRNPTDSRKPEADRNIQEILKEYGIADLHDFLAKRMELYEGVNARRRMGVASYFAALDFYRGLGDVNAGFAGAYDPSKPVDQQRVVGSVQLENLDMAVDVVAWPHFRTLAVALRNQGEEEIVEAYQVILKGMTRPDRLMLLSSMTFSETWGKLHALPRMRALFYDELLEAVREAEMNADSAKPEKARELMHVARQALALHFAYDETMEKIEAGEIRSKSLADFVSQILRLPDEKVSEMIRLGSNAVGFLPTGSKRVPRLFEEIQRYRTTGFVVDPAAELDNRVVVRAPEMTFPKDLPPHLLHVLEQEAENRQGEVAQPRPKLTVDDETWKSESKVSALLRQDIVGFLRLHGDDSTHAIIEQRLAKFGPEGLRRIILGGDEIPAVSRTIAATLLSYQWVQAALGVEGVAEILRHYPDIFKEILDVTPILAEAKEWAKAPPVTIIPTVEPPKPATVEEVKQPLPLPLPPTVEPVARRVEFPEPVRMLPFFQNIEEFGKFAREMKNTLKSLLSSEGKERVRGQIRSLAQAAGRQRALAAIFTQGDGPEASWTTRPVDVDLAAEIMKATFDLPGFGADYIVAAEKLTPGIFERLPDSTKVNRGGHSLIREAWEKLRPDEAKAEVERFQSQAAIAEEVSRLKALITEDAYAEVLKALFTKSSEVGEMTAERFMLRYLMAAGPGDATISDFSNRFRQMTISELQAFFAMGEWPKRLGELHPLAKAMIEIATTPERMMNLASSDPGTFTAISESQPAWLGALFERDRAEVAAEIAQMPARFRRKLLNVNRRETDRYNVVLEILSHQVTWFAVGAHELMGILQEEVPNELAEEVRKRAAGQNLLIRGVMEACTRKFNRRRAVR